MPKLVSKQAAPTGRQSLAPLLLTLAVFILAAGLALWNLAGQLPIARWPELLGSGAPDIHLAMASQAVLPRLVIGCLTGLLLGLAGALFQQVLRNPLVEPATLGISAGAKLALTTAILLAPGFMGSYGREAVAFLGALLALGLVMALTWKSRVATTSLILAGLIVTFYAGALASLLVIFNHDYLQTIFIWGSGSLVQNGWNDVVSMLPRLLIAIIAAGLLCRQLALLDLGDDAAGALGLRVARARFWGLLLATAISATTVSIVGIVAFIGLAAPSMTRWLGVRRLRARLVWSALLGCGLLSMTDQLVQALFPSGRELVPTGAMTALLGSPLLLFLMRRMRTEPDSLVAAPRRVRLQGGLNAALPLALLLLLVLLFLALLLGRGVDGWHLLDSDNAARLLSWRWPRVLAAGAAGIMLGTAGTLLQRLTSNPMASPEVLGLSSGVAVGVIALMFLAPGLVSPSSELGAGVLGGILTVCLLLLLGRRSAFAPEHMLLTGVAIGTAMSALATMVMASGDPRMAGLLTWMAGSTWSVEPKPALLALVMAVLGLGLALLLRRWLDLLPLGPPLARTLGLPLVRVRLVVIALAAILTAASTLLIGPLTFVGLMAPHMARLMGARLAIRHLLLAAVLGAAIMVGADWAGRMLLFPYEIPAGLMATFIGAPYLLRQLRRE